jgi:hypothetical protein
VRQASSRGQFVALPVTPQLGAWIWKGSVGGRLVPESSLHGAACYKHCKWNGVWLASEVAFRVQEDIHEVINEMHQVGGFGEPPKVRRL